MAKPQTLDSKLSPENRVVVPREVRAALGVRSGDRIVFHLGADGMVRLVTPRLLAMSVWAKNLGGDAGNSAEDIRQQRIEDQDAVEAKYARITTTDEVDARSEDEITSELMSTLGLG